MNARDDAYSAALAVLDPEDAAAIERLLDSLGFEPGELACCPPVRLLIAMAATARLAAEMPQLSRRDAFVEAGIALGLDGRSLLRRWYAWQREAVRRFVTDDGAAA